MVSDKIYIGTCGFSYKDWLGNFYPQFCPQADFLQFYSSQFHTVEIDATFYRIPGEDTVKKWAKVTPDNFIFSAKFPQSVTHEGTVDSRIESTGSFIKVMSQLGTKLGPLLLQFPYSFKPDQLDLLIMLIKILPENKKFAIEFRNKKWLEIDKIFDILKEKNISFCLIDHPWMPRSDIVTADFMYLRLLGDRKKIENDFSYVRYDRGEDLKWWQNLVSNNTPSTISKYVYINNHYSGHAPTTACSFSNLFNSIDK